MIRACSYGKNLPRLARKHFDENFSRVPRSRLLIGEISVNGKIFVHLNAAYSILSRLAGKPSHMSKTVVTVVTDFIRLALIQSGLSNMEIVH